MLTPAPVDVHVARDLSDALRAISQEGPGVRVIAGGTDILPNIKQGLVTASRLVSLARIEECRGIEVDGDGLIIGALESNAAIACRPLAVRHAPALARACGLIASPALRRMGTLGGNICLDTRCAYYNQSAQWRKALGYCLKRDGDRCHVVDGGRACVAAHTADAATALIALGARVEIAGPAGARVTDLADLYRGHEERLGGTPFAYQSPHRVAPDEILTRVMVPIREGRLAGFEKLRSRESIDYPILAIAWSAQRTADRLEDLTVVVSALSAQPRVIRFQEGTALDADSLAATIDAVTAKAHAVSHPLACLTGDPGWRRAMIPVLLGRSLRRGLGLALE